MRKIMKIFDVFEAKNRGIVVGGSDRALDTLAPDQIRDLIGMEVEVLNTDGAKGQYRVLDVQITYSITNQKNVFILLPPDTRKEDIELGAELYSLG
jgi:hypothetical protein